MFNFPLNLMLVVAVSAIVSTTNAQDEPTFLLPVTPTGEQILDVKMLTRMDEIEQKQKSQPVPLKPVKEETVTAIELPAERIVKQKNLQFQKLQEQLQELSLLWEQMRHKKVESVTPQPQMSQPETVPNETSPVAKQPFIPKPHQLQNSATILNEPTIDPIEEVLTKTVRRQQAEAELTAPKEAAGSIEQDTKQSLKGPVDRFALATSLYAVRHFSESLQAIETIQVTDLTMQESIWLDYLSAGCHRQLGATAEANRLYRRIVANPDSDWMGTVSRWWLDHTSEKQKLEAEYLTLNRAIKQWEAAVHELSK